MACDHARGSHSGGVMLARRTKDAGRYFVCGQMDRKGLYENAGKKGQGSVISVG